MTALSHSRSERSLVAVCLSRGSMPQRELCASARCNQKMEQEAAGGASQPPQHYQDYPPVREPNEV